MTRGSEMASDFFGALCYCEEVALEFVNYSTFCLANILLFASVASYTVYHIV